MSFDPAKEIELDEAHGIIRDILNSGGQFILTKHAEERMQLRNYTSNDILHMLMHGKIEQKEFNDQAENWKYKICGKDLDGDEGGVITAIIRRNAIVIITVLG